MAEPHRPPRLPWAAAIFLAVFGLYLASGSREPEWGDANGMVDAADHLLKDGDVSIGFRWPEDIPAGRGGKYYCIAPILTSLVHVPGLVVGAAGHAASPRQDGLWRPLAVHLGPAALGALIAVLFFRLARRLGVRARAASAATALLVLGTTIWVYARYPYSEILQAAAFLGFFAAAVAVIEEAGTRVVRADAIALGVWSGLVLNSKFVYGGGVVLVGLCAAWLWRRDLRALLRLTGWAMAGFLPFVVLALFYNWLRWGAITETGYGPYLAAYFGGSVFDGAWGMLASPNKSAFLYSPPLVLAAIGLPAAIRARPRLGLTLLVTVVPLFLVYASYRSWSGDYAWGPRFFVFAVPVVALGLAFFLDRVAPTWPRWLARTAIAGALVSGIAVQTLGNAFYWDHFIRITMDAKTQWLGKPNRAGSYIPERGRGHCDSCYEDMYGLLWNPPFQPIRGHWWLLTSLARGDDARAAVARAPWRRYSTLPLELRGSYDRARLDWWGLLWIKDGKGTTTTGLSLLGIMLAMLGAGGWAWRRHHHAASEPAPPDAST
ncbi:MAG: phospholipid carrier-dependent glycosyltransferase [Kofleriaceae bacterium]|jgi:hypothetical protein|nr:phospholipid carrier-dependent glycosyltransferase [Kofleriaceae bacterium]MBP6837836.1 phospholipid carrier-dependent glycosyltransferase [Kofleriaceae bacterium]